MIAQLSCLALRNSHDPQTNVLTFTFSALLVATKMTSYFEKLTSINSLKFSSTPSDLQSALEKLEQLKNENSKLELDLKCEHDEKTDLVVLKTNLESEILNLREVNERLEFQVEQLRSEKDNIHGLLARLREEEEGNNTFADKSIKV